jgi:thiol-disulfide isomerase/thioredoxin
MKKHIIIIILLVSTYFTGYTQNYHPLKVGDQMPDITISHFFDDDKKAIKISELYHHKLLILDFWATWCGACLEEMSNFPKLKTEFGDKLNIVAVDYEQKEKIAGLFKRDPFYHNKDWTTIYADTLLTSVLFPHHTLPHLVWIDSTGRVITITEGDKLTAVNIKRALDGQTIAARVKVDNENYSPQIMNKPFRQMDTNFLARSILTREMQGGGIAFASMQPYSEDKSPSFNRNYNANMSLWNLYFRALNPLDACEFNEDRLIFKCADSLRFIKPSVAKKAIENSKYKTYDNWADSNAYCYELMVPKMLPDSTLRAYMLSDLNRYLNLNGRWENREMICYAIRDQNDQSKDFKIEPDVSKEYYYNSKVESISFSALLKYFNKRVNSSYVLNESALSSSTIFNIKSDLQNNLTPEGLSSFLKKIGLKLVSVKREVPVYIVSEIK